MHRDDAGIRIEQSLSLPLGADAIVAGPDRAGTEILAELERAAKAEAMCRETRAQLNRLGIEQVELSREIPTPAIEAAEKHLQQRQPVAFEYVVPRVNRAGVFLKRFDSRQRRWLGAAVATVILLPLLLAIVRTNIEGRLTSQWDEMRKNVTELEVFQANLWQFRPWFEGAPNSLQILDALMSAFPEQGDVWAKSVQLTEESKDLHRVCQEPTGIDRPARPSACPAGLQVQQVRGDNPIQFSATYKWESTYAE